MSYNDFGYTNPLNILVKESMLSDSEMYPIWAAYSNMARCNYFNTMDYIANSVGLGDGENLENQIDKMKILNEPLDPEVELKVRRMLFQHFPFLTWACSKKIKKSSDEKNPPSDEEVQKNQTVSISEIRKCLKSFSFTLNYLRNYYSHSRSVETRDNDMIIKSRESERQTGLYLKKFTTVSARIIKDRFSGDNNSMQKEMLNEDSLSFITNGKVKFVQKDDERGMTVKEPIDNEDYFLNPLCKSKEDAIEYDRLSPVGKIMLICLFLEKKYISEFLMQAHFLQAFKSEAKAPLLSDQRILLEVMSALRFRAPKRKVDSTVDSFQVALDMLNELKKCPAELYELLGNEDRAAFNVTSSTGEPVLLRRSSDRFTQLALQWFDVNKEFKSIRFQINAGVFRYLFNDNKSCIDGKMRKRVLQEPLNGFGRIQEVEEIRQQCKNGDSSPWEGYDVKGFGEIQHNDADCLPYINDARTRYLIDGDNIGLRFSTERSDNGDYLPIIEKTDSHYRVACKPAQAIISRFELPAMLFYHLLNHKDKNGIAPVESIIIESVKNYRKLFEDVRDGVLVPEGLTESNLAEKIKNNYDINIADVPEKICDYLLGRIDSKGGFKAYKKRTVDSLLEQTEYRTKKLLDNLKTIKSDMNKPGKPGYVQIRPGALAGFLAKDIILFQEGSASQKMTGLNFSVMQGSIATFGSYEGTTIQDLNTIFKTAGLIAPNGNRGSHPFLGTVMASSPANTIDFYKKYLVERKKYLSGVVPETASFLHADRSRWTVRDDDFYRAYAGRCLERPIMLPRQLFESRIREYLMSLKGCKAEALKAVLIEAGNHCNTTFMIQKYFEIIKEDFPQAFHGVYEGDIDHAYGYRFFILVRKYQKEAHKIRKNLLSSKDQHKVYTTELKRALDWAKDNPLQDSEESTTVMPAAPKPSFEDISKKLKGSFKTYMDTEKTLRRYVIQDELMYMAAMKSIKSELETPNIRDWMLGNISPHGDCVLNCISPSVRTHVTFKKVDRDPKTHEVKKIIRVPVTIEQNDIKLKDYGDVFKLIHDNRLESILESHKNEIISAKELEKELESYDQRRVGVFKDIMDYEKKVTDGIPDSELRGVFNKVNAKHMDFKVMQYFDHDNNELTKQELRQIRNAFCHNSYPPKEVFVGNYSDRKTRQLHEAKLPGTADTISDRAKKISENTKKRE